MYADCILVIFHYVHIFINGRAFATTLFALLVMNITFVVILSRNIDNTRQYITIAMICSTPNQ